jgi:thiol-disulfide isomerase/thioredoxin
MRRRILIVAVGLLALAIGGYVGHRVLTPGESSGVGGDASMLLGVALPDASGNQQPLSQWKGKVLVVNFWATWCPPCRDEMPEFVLAQRELGGRGVQFVGIAVDEPDKVRHFAREIGLNYPALIGGYGAIELSRTLGNRVGGLPFTVIVDRGGRVAHVQLGPLPDAKLRSIVWQLI